MKGKRRPIARNKEQIDYDDLLRKLMELLLAYRGMIRVTILKNIALVTYALVTLYHGARGETVGSRKRPWPAVCRWVQDRKRENRGFTGSWAIIG